MKLHAVCDGKGRPLDMLPSEGQMSDYECAHAFMSAICIAASVIFWLNQSIPSLSEAE